MAGRTHCEDINTVAREGFNPSNKKGLSGSQEKPSDHLGFPLALALWFWAAVYLFLISWFRSRLLPCFKDIRIATIWQWGVNFVEAEWPLATNTKIFIDHCEIMHIYFTKVTKDFNKHKSLQGEEIHNLWSKDAFEENFILLTERENQIPVWYQLTVTKFVYLVNLWKISS